MKAFNTTAVCIPSKHYMVDITDKVNAIKELVDAGKYFTINRARQYGKTTTITALQQCLIADYEVVSLSFEGIGKDGFKDEPSFVIAFCRRILRECRRSVSLPESIRERLEDYIARKTNRAKLDELFETFSEWCELSAKAIVLIIDEVDSATNNQVFLDFLAQLRDNYISREAKGICTFQSVILAGVTDVKHLKQKIRKDMDAKENSPWNIAADFTVDMSLSEKGIKDMLEDYEADHHTGMDAAAIAKQIRAYTSGYPFLVSRICQLLDSSVSQILGSLSAAWTARGMDEAVKMLLSEENTLFQTLTTKLNNFPALKASIRSILMEGTKLTYNPDQSEISQLQMYGLIRNDNNTVRIANRIFETRLYNLFLSEEEIRNNVFSREGELAKNQFVHDGKLDMRLIMERFIDTFTQIFGPLEERFKEKDGREYFLLYIKPIINGTGNYYIEAQTRDQTRTDVIIDYLGQQYILELKIWYGPKRHEEGEKVLFEGTV